MASMSNIIFGKTSKTRQQKDHLGSKSSEWRTQTIVSTKSTKLNVNMSGKTGCLYMFEERNKFSTLVHIKYD